MTQQENSAIATALLIPIAGYIIELLKERNKTQSDDKPKSSNFPRQCLGRGGEVMKIEIK